MHSRQGYLIRFQFRVDFYSNFYLSLSNKIYSAKKDILTNVLSSPPGRVSPSFHVAPPSTGVKAPRGCSVGGGSKPFCSLSSSAVCVLYLAHVSLKTLKTPRSECCLPYEPLSVENQPRGKVILKHRKDMLFIKLPKINYLSRKCRVRCSESL